MIIIEQLTLEHTRAMAIQEAQLTVGPLVKDDAYIASLIAAGPAYAVVVDGSTIAIAGVSIFWKGRGFGWATLSALAAPHMRELTREVRNFLKFSSISRIETAVDCRFKQGHQWARMLGLQKEGTMRAWGPQGDDFDLYARIK